MSSSTEKRLFLLDAYALIYRAYYALIRAPRVTSKGLNTSAIFGFCNTLEEILRKENPTHIAVCFDPVGGHTFRHEMYADYKAQRDKQPEDITLSVPYIKQILDAYRIPVIEIEGYEADDVIGTISRRAENAGFDTYMMTPDKDYSQLVTDHVLMYRPALRGEGFEIRGPQQVCDRYGISSPRQVIDLLALEGDASDNIPGCPGVGEKTAAKLIAEWGSVENLLDNVGSLKGALQRKIIDNADKIRFSKVLATIRTDVPMEGFSLDEMVRKEIDVDRLKEIYRELEFRTFLTRLNASVGAASSRPQEGPVQGSLFDLPEAGQPTDAPATVASLSIAARDHQYSVADTLDKIAAAVENASRCDRIGISIASVGDDAMTARTLALAIADCEGRAVYMDLTGESRNDILAIVAPLFAAKTPQVVSHDIKRDILLLKRLGVEMANEYFDTSVAHYLIEPEMKHQLSMLSLKYLDYDMMPAADKKMAKTDVQRADRTCETAETVLRLVAPLMAEIEQNGLGKLLEEIELPLIRVLAEMEWTGVRVDVAELDALSQRYSKRLNEMEEEVYRLAGIRFNIGSPMQVGEILFDRLKLDQSAKKTKRGFYSTTEEILEKHRADHPIVGLILDIRALRKLLATYINALPALVNPLTGKIHTSYNQTVTATGRISSTNPNLQNIPVRTDDGREIRKAFIADPGDTLLAADYSQIELRLMADMSGDPDMLEAFHSGEDIHRATAAKIYHTPLADVTSTQRRNAKTANFGIIYGISAFGLSERLGISRSEAKDLITGYFKTYPGVKEYMDRSIATARDQGYVTTIEGRRRMLPDIHSRNSVVRSYAERNAINAPLQGSAADIIKIAMVRIYDEMTRRSMRSRMIMQVHDELVFNVAPDEVEQLRELVVRNMEHAYSGRVAMEVSVGTGDNWLQAH
ncbi:MAG: DNA polymerase I [Bacteroides sp.]|nr:DNA polymerase I [Bacteroides sp.]MCM1413973.1 DNA polymerase I [Bacteroides sp.]MCM1471810.1 DNA polymerase I [Bacteroides sp.]